MLSTAVSVRNVKYVNKVYKLKIFLSCGAVTEKELKSIYTKCDLKKDKHELIHTNLSSSPANENLDNISYLKLQYNLNVSYGSHSKDKQIFIKAKKHNPETFFFYVKSNENLIFPDNEHALVEADVKRLINQLNKNNNE